MDLGSRLRAFDPAPVPGMEAWQLLETPSHTPGHVCFFRAEDAVLLAGDAVTTMNLDSFFATIAKRKQCPSACPPLRTGTAPASRPAFWRACARP